MKQELFNYTNEFRKHCLTAIIAALGFIIALSWRDFIKSSINQAVAYFGITENLFLYELLSAMIITFLAVAGIIIISKFQVKKNGR